MPDTYHGMATNNKGRDHVWNGMNPLGAAKMLIAVGLLVVPAVAIMLTVA